MWESNVLGYLYNPVRRGKNLAATPSALADWGFLDIENNDAVTPMGQALVDGQTTWPDTVLLALSKRNGAKDNNHVKPLVVIAQFITQCLKAGIERPIVTFNDLSMLCSVETYDTMTTGFIRQIMDSPDRYSASNTSSYLDIWFNALAETQLFFIKKDDSTNNIKALSFKSSEIYNSFVETLGNLGPTISETPLKSSKLAYYDCMGDLKSGILQILPDFDKDVASKVCPTLLELTSTPTATVAPDQYLQVIYYGAPGTGKSFKIDDMTTDKNSVRTTFHPDTDYSTFVGAYKPTMQPMPIHAFVGTTVHHADDADGGKAYGKKIVYKYVPQAFLKAYVEAWKDLDTRYYLIIEEINRGNCAQIFGDLFQLLDRNSQGASSYAINADEDIAQFLSSDDNGFAKLTQPQRDAINNFILKKDNGKVEKIGADILSGKKMLLPPNLHIWATMNTSDQSLFPIDSAFKRRWNWEYIPISFFDNDTDQSLARRSFQIGKTRYSWASFLKIINPIISELTESADKQMGFFFAKPDRKSDPTLKDNDVISEKIFLNKVLFYLWGDVLKDYNIGREEFKKPDGDGKPLEFADFFDGSKDYLTQFVAKLGVAVIGNDSTPSPNKPADITPADDTAE